MSWNDFSIAIGEYLNKEGFAFQPKKRVHTKKYGDLTACVDIAKQDVYFFGGDAGNQYDDPKGILSGIRDSIVEIVGAQVASQDEAPVQNDIEEYIKGADELQSEEQTQKANDALGLIAPANVLVVHDAAQPPYKPQGTIIHGFVPQLKEIGKIKIGRKGETRQGKSGEYRLPEKFDHFEVVSLIKDEHGNFIPDKIMGSLDTDPKELDIILLYNDPTLNFYTRYNEYKGGKRQCSGDGKLATDINDNKITCNPDTCVKFQTKKCKPNGILSVILTKSPRLGGVYKFRTTGWNSIRSILSSMMFLQTATGGTLAGIPLKLTLTPQQAQPKDSPTAHTIYVVNIEFAGTMDQLLNETIKTIQIRQSMQADIQKLESTARLAMDAPESSEEILEIESEWYPEVPT